jgi:hypothetical protein
MEHAAFPVVVKERPAELSDPIEMTSLDLIGCITEPAQFSDHPPSSAPAGSTKPRAIAAAAAAKTDLVSVRLPFLQLIRNCNHARLIGRRFASEGFAIPTAACQQQARPRHGDGTCRSRARSKCAVAKPPAGGKDSLDREHPGRCMMSAYAISSRCAMDRRLARASVLPEAWPAAGSFSRARSMYRSHDRECPRCGGPAYRVQRRAIDRLISLFLPRRRFRCGSMGCGWEGNLPLRPSSAPLTRKR